MGIEMKMRLLDLIIRELKLVRDGKRDIEEVIAVFQSVKDTLIFKPETFPVWRTLAIGGKNRNKVLRRLQEDENINLSEWAKHIIAGHSAFKTSKRPYKVSFVRIEPSSLGFSQRPAVTELLARAKEQELNLCPIEAVPYLLLASIDQPRDSWFLIAVEPILSNADLFVFRIGRHSNGKKWLGVYSANNRCDLNRKIVFIK